MLNFLDPPPAPNSRGLKRFIFWMCVCVCVCEPFVCRVSSVDRQVPPCTLFEGSMITASMALVIVSCSGGVAGGAE